MNASHVPRRPACAPLLASLALTALAAGCASGPYKTALQVQSTKQLNLTFDEKPSSVNIRVFQLIDQGPFLDTGRTTAELFSDDPGLPAQTWVQPVVDADVYIDSTADIEIEIKPKVRFLGIVAVFNEQDGESRVLLPVDDIDDKKLFFDRYSLSVRDRDDDGATEGADDGAASEEAR